MSFRLIIISSFVLIILFEIYFYRKVLKAIKTTFPTLSRKKLKKWFISIFIFFNLFPLYLLGALIYSNILNNAWPGIPESALFDYLIQYPFWISVLLVVQSILFFILIEFLKFVFFVVRKFNRHFDKHRDRAKSLEAKAVLVITTLFVVYIPARIIYDYNKVSIRIVEHKKEGLPAELNNFKITFISDLQADKYTDKERLGNFISKVNSTNPDLVLFGGDVVTSTPNYIEDGAEYLGRIEADYGVYATVGDHDNWAFRRDYARSRNTIIAALEKNDVTMIDNGTRIINVGNAEICITFVTDTYSKGIDNDTLDALVRDLGCDLNILLAHQPRPSLIKAAEKNDYDLFLSGHTHGGQVTFLFPFKNLSPTLIETKYVRGNFHIGDMLLIVTRGLGMSLVPLRYNSTPEVTVIVLKSK